MWFSIKYLDRFKMVHQILIMECIRTFVDEKNYMSWEIEIESILRIVVFLLLDILSLNEPYRRCLDLRSYEWSILKKYYTHVE